LAQCYLTLTLPLYLRTQSIVPLVAECFLHIMRADGAAGPVPDSSDTAFSAATHLTMSTAKKFEFLSRGGVSLSPSKSAGRGGGDEDDDEI
jgi:hypothetical protein